MENILTQRVKLQQLYCANLMNIQPVPEEEQQTQPEMSRMTVNLWKTDGINGEEYG